MATRLEAIAIRLEAIASRLEAFAIRLGAIAGRLEAIASRLEAIANMLEAIAIRLEAIANMLEAFAIRLGAIAGRLEAIASRLESGWRFIHAHSVRAVWSTGCLQLYYSLPVHTMHVWSLRTKRYMSRQAWVLSSILETLSVDDYARSPEIAHGAHGANGLRLSTRVEMGVARSIKKPNAAVLSSVRRKRKTW